MKTRVRRWKRYREKIAASSFKGASAGSGHAEAMDSRDKEELDKLELSSEAIALQGDKLTEATPYERYVKGKRRLLTFKIALLVAAVIALVLFYLLWVGG